MSPSRDKLEERLSGIAISPGIAWAKACMFNEDRHSRLPTKRVRAEDVDEEVFRLSGAIAEALRRLADLKGRVQRDIGKAEAEIFVAQSMILDDPKLRAQMMEAIRRDHAGAETAVMEVFDAYEARMREMADPRFRERASDIVELKQRLLDALADLSPGLLCEVEGRCQRGRDRIVVARELTPSLTVELQTDRLKGFATEHGGPTSHAGILARALGIPAVSGLKGVYDLVPCGTELLINGDTGEVILWPTAKTLAQHKIGSGGAVRSTEVVAPVPGFRVMANISRSDDVAEAVRMQAEGIGLYRTEFEFMAAGRVLDEDEQYERYVAVLRAMKNRPVVVRLLDIGGDKPAPFLDLPGEANPSLGFRGARLLLGKPELLRPQARALARASRDGEIHVLYPMIVDLDQFRRLRKAFREATRDIRGTRLKHGVMFEVPSACLQAAEILEEADFGSIGTNDLIQYLFAVDRNNELVAGDVALDVPVLWSLIRDIARASRRTGKPVSLCGEIGGSPESVARLIEAGIRTVSASTLVISSVRRSAMKHRESVRRRKSRTGR